MVADIERLDPAGQGSAKNSLLMAAMVPSAATLKKKAVPLPRSMSQRETPFTSSTVTGTVEPGKTTSVSLNPRLSLAGRPPLLGSMVIEVVLNWRVSKIPGFPTGSDSTRFAAPAGENRPGTAGSRISPMPAAALTSTPKMIAAKLPNVRV